MSVEVERATIPCGVCGAQVTELRRGRCWGCYQRWADNRPVGKGAACVVCGERRRGQLRLTEIHQRSLPMCHGCAALTAKLSPVPATIDAIKYELRRDRRDDDRRIGKADGRIFPRERRVGERRSPPRTRSGDTDPAIAMPDFGDLEIEIGEDELEEIEQTMVRESRRPEGSGPTADTRVVEPDALVLAALKP